jgi:hypothetical protein
MSRFKATIEKMSSGGMHFIRVDQTIAKRFLEAGSKRVLCVVNGKHELHCAIQNSKDVGYYIALGGSTLKAIGEKAGAVLQLDLKPDELPNQLPVPEELEEVFSSDGDAAKVFESLTDGNRRSLIYLVLQVKSSDKRIERSLRIAENLKRGVHSAKLILK